MFAPSSNVGTFLPAFWQENAGGDVFVHSYDEANGGAFVGEAVLAWTAPTAGTLNFSGYFYYGHGLLQRSNDVYVRNGATLLDSRTISYQNYNDAASPWQFAFNNVSVNAGDVISFTFARTAGFSTGAIVGGNVQVALTPTISVPEPGTTLLMMAGIAAFFLIARSSKRAAGKGFRQIA